MRPPPNKPQMCRSSSLLLLFVAMALTFGSVLLFQAAQVPQKKKSSESMNASSCSDVRPARVLVFVLAQSENDPRRVCGLGSDNWAYSTVVR